MSNVFEHGTLIVLSTSCWGNSKQLNEEKAKNLSNKEIGKKWLRMNKSLIDKEALAEIRSSITKIRSIIISYSLPFPIEGIYFIPTELIPIVSEKLDEEIGKFWDHVSSFEKDFEVYKEEAQYTLNDLFNESDYPDNIASKFNIEYRFLQMEVPGKMKEISPKLYQEEMTKFKQLMEDARNQGILYLREGFLQVIEGLSKSLSGKDGSGPKRIREDVLDRVDKFYSEFQKKDIFKDEELLKVIRNAKDLFAGVDVRDLRESEKLRELMVDNIEEISSTLKESVTKFKRRISL